MRAFNSLFKTATLSLILPGLFCATVFAQRTTASHSSYRGGTGNYYYLQEAAESSGIENNEGGTELPEWEPEEEEEEEESPYDEPLETERHDFTQSARVVGRGVGQLEYGFLYLYKEDAGEEENTFLTPELLIRYGLTERLEIRSRWNYGWKDFNEADDADGLLDAVLSLKYQVTEPCNLCPESALELRLSAPLGGDDVSTGRWEPGIDYIYGWKLGHYFTLTGSTGANSNGLGDIAFVGANFDPSDRFIAWTQSAALGAKLTRRMTGYFEWFGIYTDGREEETTSNFLNGGVDYLLNKNVVIDFRLGWGLNDQSDDVFAGVGGGLRF